MTAREMAIPGQNRFTVTGEGYSTQGESSTSEVHGSTSTPMLRRSWPCRRLEGEGLIGDPTEGALIVLGAKGGLDVDETRATYCGSRRSRSILEYKFMATFHEMTEPGRGAVVRCVKGAPDVPICAAEPTGAPTGRSCRSPTTTGTWPSRRTTAWRRAASA